MAKVTVITPSYNKPKYVLDSIKSVINQTFKDWDYIIFENSTDGITRDVIKNYLKEAKDDRIIYIESNFGQSTRDKCYIPSIICNAGYLIGSGNYIFYISDDDIIDPACLESMVRYSEENQASCYVRAARSWLRGDKFVTEDALQFGITFTSLVKPDCQIDGGSVLYRKSVIENIVASEGGMNLFHTQKHADTHHEDGLFLNKYASYDPIRPCAYNSDKMLLIHRYTELSTWTKN